MAHNTFHHHMKMFEQIVSEEDVTRFKRILERERNRKTRSQIPNTKDSDRSKKHQKLTKNNTRKRSLSKLKSQRKSSRKGQIISSLSDELPLAKRRKVFCREITTDESSSDIVLLRRKRKKLFGSSSSSNDLDQLLSQQTTLTPPSAVNLIPSESFEAIEGHTQKVWCRGVCNICPDNWSEDEESRRWIQCFKCGGWWHQEHANLKSVDQRFLNSLRWCCESIGIEITCPGAPSESPFSLGL